jgi:hypothetical protein
MHHVGQVLFMHSMGYTHSSDGTLQPPILYQQRTVLHFGRRCVCVSMEYHPLTTVTKYWKDNVTGHSSTNRISPSILPPTIHPSTDSPAAHGPCNPAADVATAAHTKHTRAAAGAASTASTKGPLKEVIAAQLFSQLSPLRHPTVRHHHCSMGTFVITLRFFYLHRAGSSIAAV